MSKTQDSAVQKREQDNGDNPVQPDDSDYTPSEQAQQDGQPEVSERKRVQSWADMSATSDEDELAD